MQDAVQTIGAGGGRMFAGVGVGDRRLRPHSHHHQQALKCPRCESLNTKFCYYNNYNLSQPRHFCKSCRRYWTKGGVLRNVPVGGGCRKAKRSSSSKAKKDQATVPTQPPESTATNNKSSSSTTETSAGLLVATHDQNQQASMGGFGCTMLTSSDDLMGFSDPTTSYENEFKVVDYGDSGLFDLTAAVDPNYWNDQSTSLNFLP